MRFLEIEPLETATGALRAVLSGGRSLLLESQQGLLSYDEKRVTVKTREGVLTVLGEGMRISHFGESDMLIRGKITALFLGDAP